MPELLLKTIRNDITECMFSGWICVIDKNKKAIYKKGDLSNVVFLRSCAKPIQAISTVQNDLQFSQRELAVIVASHSGSKEHLQILKKLLKKQKLSVSNLQCGVHYPSDEDERSFLVYKKLKPTQLHNNCSGKHLGMLAVCKKNNWDLKSYININHPLQKQILKYVEDLSETKKIITAVDGCNAPTFAIPLINIAKLFSNFTSLKNNDTKKIIDAIRENPYIIGGKGQVDSEIIKASAGKLISKVGAEGIIVVAYNGNVAVVKIADGSQKARSIIITRLLLKLGWLKQCEIANSSLKDYFCKELKNLSGKVVGENIDYI